MGNNLSHRAIVMLSVAAIVLSLLGTYSVMVLTDSPTPQNDQITVNAVQEVSQPTQTSQILFEVFNPEVEEENQ